MTGTVAGGMGPSYNYTFSVTPVGAGTFSQAMFLGVNSTSQSTTYTATTISSPVTITVTITDINCVDTDFASVNISQIAPVADVSQSVLDADQNVSEIISEADIASGGDNISTAGSTVVAATTNFASSTVVIQAALGTTNAGIEPIRTPANQALVSQWNSVSGPNQGLSLDLGGGGTSGGGGSVSTVGGVVGNANSNTTNLTSTGRFRLNLINRAFIEEQQIEAAWRRARDLYRSITGQ